MSAENIYQQYKNGEIGIAKLFHMLYSAKEADPKFKINTDIYQLIVNYINGFDSESVEWQLLTGADDYSMALFKTRSLPYFNVDDPRWQEINVQVRYDKDKKPMKIDKIVERIDEIQATKEPEAEEPEAKEAEKPEDGQPATKKSRKPRAKKSNTSEASEAKAKESKPKKSKAEQQKEEGPKEEGKELTIAELYDETRPINSSKKDDYGVEKELADKPTNNGRVVAIANPNTLPKLDVIIRNINMFYDFDIKTEALLFALKLAYNYKTCHIIYEPSFWDFMTRANVHNQIVRYVLQYANYILKHEEMIMMSDVHIKNRIVTTLDRACRLPNFYANSIELNPHLVHITGRDNLSRCVPFYLEGTRKLCTMEEFQERFDIATNGIFKGIDLTKYNACISGSILVPCVHKSPLEKMFNSFKEYLEYYYPGYDSLVPNAELQETFGYNLLADVDIAIRTEAGQDYEALANELIEQIKTNVANIKINIVSNARKMKKFQLAPDNPDIECRLTRPMEIFHIFNSTAIKMVKRFHLPLVRMYYDGKEVTMLRSCIAALLTGICDSYKWFSSNKIAADVMLKYAQRGISIILNENERIILQEYIRSNGRWKTLPVDKWFGLCSTQHIFFHPDKWQGGLRYGLKPLTCNVKFNPINSFGTNSKPNFSMKIGDTLVYDTTKIYPPNPVMLGNYCRSLYDKTGKATLDDMFGEFSIEDMTQSHKQSMSVDASDATALSDATKSSDRPRVPMVEEKKYVKQEEVKNVSRKKDPEDDGTTVERIGKILEFPQAPEINNEWSDEETYIKIEDSVEYDDA